MSDIGPFESFLKWELSIESPSLAYAAKAVTRNVLFAVDIPYPLLKTWHEFLSKASRQNDNSSSITSVDQNPSTSGTSDEVPPYTYTDLLEFSIPGNSVGISEDPTTRTEIHKHLQRLAGAVCSEYKRAKGGRQSQEVNKKCKRFHIYEGQTVDLMALRMQNELIQDELQEWKKSYSDLESELKKLFQEMQVAIQEKDKRIEHLQTINEDLSSYVSTLEKLAYKGKDISKVSKNQH